MLTGTTPAPERDRIAHALHTRPLIVVGTHALLEDWVQPSHLGLVIVDEQHRFGVAQRDILRDKGVDNTVPHQLVMTATPIPRTIAMTVFGDLDQTRMSGLPTGRTPITTYLVDTENAHWMQRLWTRAREEIDAGGRVYVVCPRITDTTPEDSTDLISDDDLATWDTDDSGDSLFAPVRQQPIRSTGPTPPLASVEGVARDLATGPFPDIPIATLTGQTSDADKDATMARFASGETPLLVATTVIEVGVDVPDATMIVILDSQQFGLSQLHQLRGRVGRGTRPSICMAVHRHDLTPESRKRLDVFATTTDGFELAEADVHLRRVGDVLGSAQSGRLTSLKFISVVRDADIIVNARTCAEKLNTSDPGYTHHPELRAEVLTRLPSDALWMQRS